jgi:cephalosporin-C deacetylase-like acetyl esterase
MMTAAVAGPVKPADFDAYWSAIDDELARFPIAAEARHTPLHDTEFSTSYDVELTGIGPYRLFGFLSIPKGTGPFPAMLITPRYGSVATPAHWDDRQRYICFTIVHRGQRLADKPFAAAYPGLLTVGIDDPETYIYRSIAADCLRGLEYLLSLDEVDPSRVVVVGDDLAAITAARRPGTVSAMHVTGLMFHRLMDVRKRTDMYPIEEINDSIRLFADRKATISNTVSYFDPQHHAGAISVPVLVAAGDNNAVNGPEWLAGLTGAFAGNVELYQLTHEGQRDHDAMDAWISEKMTIEPRPRIWEISR